MGLDNTSDLFPSGFNATPYEEGDIDFGVPEYPTVLWLAQMDLRSLADGSDMGVAYRLMWSTDCGEGAHLKGELWLQPGQMRELMIQYAMISAEESTE